jgi:hypothetical protein
MTVVGRVVSIKRPHPQELGGRTRILIQHESGWKVFGSLPASLAEEGLVGSTVQLDAAVKASERDPKFGFFSRPTKARVVA